MIKFIFSLIFYSALIAFLIWIIAPRNGMTIYRCNWAEISPDIPIEVKNECRKRILHGAI